MTRARPLPIASPSAGPFKRLFGLLWLCAPLLCAVGGFFVVETYVYYARDLPDPPRADRRSAYGATRFFAQDGRLLGELGAERHEPLELGTLPSYVYLAFISAEDRRFFEHGGIDPWALARATWRNLRLGQAVYGASTLTQQLAKKQVGQARHLERKIREAILARRIEAVLSKREILHLYLDEVYLGQGAYGVEAAAQRYFGRPAAQLTLAQAATLAGLPPQPARVNPVLAPELSLLRRAYVLRRMLADGHIDEAQAREALAQPLDLVTPARTLEQRSPGYVEQARRMLPELLPAHAQPLQGLHVRLAVQPALQAAARQALASGIEQLGQRQGYVGPEARLEGAALREALARAAQHYAGLTALDPHRSYVGIVTGLDADHAQIQIGPLRASLSRMRGAHWAVPYQTKAARNGGELADLRTILRAGDVIRVRALAQAPAMAALQRGGGPTQAAGSAPDGAAEVSADFEVQLDQSPPLEGAFIAQDRATDAVVALVGAYDVDRSAYHRAFQACRQPGSVFKPIVFALALEGAYTLASRLADTPVTVYEQKASFLWKPKNFSGKFRGEVALYEALAWSLNLPAVRLIQQLGPAQVVRFAQRLGLTTPMPAQPSLVLGSACVRPWELLQVYALFARGGRSAQPRIVTQITDGAGTLWYEDAHFGDLWAPAQSLGPSLLRALLAPPARRLSREASYLMRAGLQAVIEQGTAQHAQALGHPAAGKTGTTDAYDAWFMGFTRHWVAGLWIGADRNQRPLGRGETAGTVALPVWLTWMLKAHEGRPALPLLSPIPEGIIWAAVDPNREALAAPGRRALHLPFKSGTQPRHVAESATGSPVRRLEQIEGRF